MGLICFYFCMLLQCPESFQLGAHFSKKVKYPYNKKYGMSNYLLDYFYFAFAFIAQWSAVQFSCHQ